MYIVLLRNLEGYYLKMNILVTGAGGFAGSNIIRYFLVRGHRVVGTYRNSKSFDLESIVCDLVFQELPEKINISGIFDAIVHTGCTQPGINNDFLTYKKGNIDSMEQLIDFALRRKIKNFIYFSSRSIYGEINDEEVFEDNDIINQDAYGLTKYVGECLLRNVRKDINIICLWVPGISGPGAHDTWLVETVSRLINKQEAFVTDFYTKNFVWIFDIATFIEKLIEKWMKNEKVKYDTVNLACIIGANNTDIVNEIKLRTKSKSKVIIKKLETKLFVLNTDKAIELGFSPLSVM